jgi:cytochrome oxidase Cu insertion factor (SCO1/SenC/PrrC family)
MSGKPSTLEAHLLKDKPNVLLFVHYSCSFSCSTLLRQSRRVLSESGLKIGEDLGVVTVGFGPQDTWQLARQRALKAYERFPDREKIEDRWVFAVSNDKTLFEKYELSRHIPKLVMLGNGGQVTTVFTHDTLSTASFLQAFRDANESKVSYYSINGDECPEDSLKPSIGLLAMRAGVVASLVIFFGIVCFHIRRS